MARNKAQNEATLLRRRERVASMYLQRHTQRDIGKRLRLSAGTICRDLKAIQAEWLKSAVANVQKRKAEELARVDTLERTYWRSWRRSLRRKKENPRYLEGVQWCIRQRLEILGVLSSQGGGTTNNVTVYQGVDLSVVAGDKPNPGVSYADLQRQAACPG